MKHIETILDGCNGSDIHPTVIQPETPHKYDDKFALAEIVKSTSIAS
jgi:hypothetical protein